MPSFYTIHTNAGLAALSAAEVSGTPVQISALAVGDGNGVAVTPDPGSTALARERFRAAPNRVYQNPENAAQFIAELVIPAAEGGFTMREVGAFDSGGQLLVVGNLPETYKPTPGDGAYADSVVRFVFAVTNAATVAIVADDAVSTATREWVESTITVGGLIPGGTTGQILAKASNSDGDVHWQTPGEVNVTVSTVDEVAVLAAGQTVVDLATVTTEGLAVYVEGLRLVRGPAADQWEPATGVPDRVVFGQSYAAGTECLFVQNEPAGAAGQPLQAAANLSDVEDVAQARQNLGVAHVSAVVAAGPPGMVADFAMITPPAGWLKCNGAAVSRSAYPELFAAIGTTWGAGDGFTTFNVPDVRGEFRRGWDDGRGIDAGRAFASEQAESVGAHTHPARAFVPWNSPRDTSEYSDPAFKAMSSDPLSDNNRLNPNPPVLTETAVDANTGAETRPRNVAFLTCIKY